LARVLRAFAAGVRSSSSEVADRSSFGIEWVKRVWEGCEEGM
jgi:hypothetical protein